MPSVPTPITKQIDTAVIPIAGLGTRMAPYTAGSAKFMAPIYAGNQARPNIDYTLEDCLAAGVKNFIFITSNGGAKILQEYLGPLRDDTVARYHEVGKLKDLEAEQARRAAYADMNITCIDQPLGKYGTAIPLSLAREALAGVKHFLFTGGDDFIWNPDGSSESVKQISAWQQSGRTYSLMGRAVPREEGPAYGILTLNPDGTLNHIAEKPALETLPPGMALANVTRYILGEDIWPHLDGLLAESRDSSQPEYYITDVVNRASTSGLSFDVHAVVGMYFDAGSPQGALQASDTITRHLQAR